MDYTVASISGNLKEILPQWAGVMDLILGSKIWNVLGSVGTAVAAIFAFLAIKQSNQHLEIEQTPFVVAQIIKKYTSKVELSIQNIGRGSALHVTGCKSEDKNNRDDAFFRNTESHSVNLASGGKKLDWIIDKNIFDNLNLDNEGYKHFFIFYESQLPTIYRTDVKVKDYNEDRGNNCYVVMDNKFKKIGKVGI